MNKTLHPLLWLWIPIAIMLIQIGIETLIPKEHLGALHSEDGPHELAQFVISLIAMLYAFRCLFLAVPAKQPFLTAWIACFCLGCAYIAGEEVSWGQHIFEWGTSDFWSEINDQNETNFHNTSSWLDQKPRLLLLIGTIVGGLIIPALAKFKPSALPEQFQIIYPPAILSVTAGFALLIKILDKFQEAVDLSLFTRASEVEELYLFYFVLLYLVLMSRTLKEKKISDQKP